MAIFRASLLFGILAMVPVSASTSPPAKNAAAETNVVELTISRDGVVVGTPKLIMQLGCSAVMTVTGPGGYSLKGALTTDSRLANGRKLDIELFIVQNGRWQLLGKPSLSSQLNRNVSLRLTDPEGKVLTIESKIGNKFSGDLSMKGWGHNRCSEKKIAAWRTMMSLPVDAYIVKAGQFTGRELC